MQPTVLMVLDGWGIAEPGPANAITSAPDRVVSRLAETYPSTQLAAHGREVGLLPDQMGDSNVGHLTIGAGRVIDQNLPRIFRAIEEGTLAKSPAIREMIREAKAGRRLHFLGLLSPGGVHSHERHLGALLEIAEAAGLTDVFLHIWLDGRDVPPESATQSLEYLAGEINRTGVGRIATMGGRYYAMDRDKRWDRTEKAYRAMVEGKGPKARSAPEALTQSYADDASDEFVVPTVLTDENGEPVGRIGEDDVVFVFNFRADRVRQITRALADPDFDAFARPFPRVHWLGGMTVYDEAFELPHVFEPQDAAHNLAEWLSERGITQLHVAETEKYAHVTFFFNGGQERQYPGEDREMVPSPKVATYDLEPAMSAHGIADIVVRAIAEGRYGFIVLNFANADMVGHTGKLEAAREAIRAVGVEIDRIATAVREAGGALLITADHGNAEVMEDGDGGANTNHTTNPVPFVLVCDAAEFRHARLRPGALKDVAPTVLDVMGIEPPSEMTGRSLLDRPGD